MNNVLVLNSGMYAIHIIDWQKAISLIYRGQASVVDEDYRRYNFDEWTELSAMISDSPNGFVHSVNLKVAVPEVIALNFYDRLPDSDVKFTRKNIYHHYVSKCCYCGKRFATPQLNLDHVIPRSKGGTTSWDNIVLSCIPCNTKKANRTPVEAGLKMHYSPSKPKWKPALSLHIKTGVPLRHSWQKFVDVLYWNSELKE